MIIVDTNLRIKPVLFQSLIILVIILNIRDSGRLKVHSQREFEYIAFIGIEPAILIVHMSFQTNDVLGIISKIVLGGIEFHLDIRRINRATISVRLTDIRIGSLKDLFSGGCIGDRNIHLSCVSEQTCPNKTQ